MKGLCRWYVSLWGNLIAEIVHTDHITWAITRAEWNGFKAGLSLLWVYLVLFLWMVLAVLDLTHISIYMAAILMRQVVTGFDSDFGGQ